MNDIITALVLLLSLLQFTEASSILSDNKGNHTDNIPYFRPLIVPTKKPNEPSIVSAPTKNSLKGQQSPASRSDSVATQPSSPAHPAHPLVPSSANSNRRSLKDTPKPSVWVAPSVPGEDTPAPVQIPATKKKNTPKPSVWVAPSVPGQDTAAPVAHAEKVTTFKPTRDPNRSHRPHKYGESDDDTTTCLPTKKPVNEATIDGVVTSKPTIDYSPVDETINYGGPDNQGTVWYISGLVLSAAIVLMW